MPEKDLLADRSSAEMQEREKVQRAIGGIGGKPRSKGKILNIAFVVAVCGAFAASLLTAGISQIASIDIGILLLSLKFAYHLHTEAKVNHAQFWILTTLEDRLLDVIGELRGLRRELREFVSPKQDDPPPPAPTGEHPRPRQED